MNKTFLVLLLLLSLPAFAQEPWSGTITIGSFTYLGTVQGVSAYEVHLDAQGVMLNLIPIAKWTVYVGDSSFSEGPTSTIDQPNEGWMLYGGFVRHVLPPRSLHRAAGAAIEEWRAGDAHPGERGYLHNKRHRDSRSLGAARKESSDRKSIHSHRAPADHGELRFN
jgi:hypothetical protein